MKTIIKAIPVTIDSTPSKDGKSTYYKISLAQGGEVMTFSTNLGVFDYVRVNLYKPVELELTLSEGVYDGKVYSRKFISGVVGNSPKA